MEDQAEEVEAPAQEEQSPNLPPAEAKLWERRAYWVREVHAREGKAHKANISDVREVMKLLVTMEAEHMALTGSAITGPVSVLRAEADALFLKNQTAARKAASKQEEKVEDGQEQA